MVVYCGWFGGRGDGKDLLKNVSYTVIGIDDDDDDVEVVSIVVVGESDIEW